MTWLAILALVLVLVFRAPRSGWEAILAALVLGLAGYAAQGHPGVAGAPHAPAESVDINSASLIKERQKLSGEVANANSWMVIADALSRHGQYGNAATVLRGAVDKEPGTSDAWLAMANALVGHADGSLSPAALYAYRHAEAADPAAPGPPFFMGMAMARSGRFAEARNLWAGLLARSPKDAPWRGDLKRRLARLDKMIEMSGQMGQPPR